tara:strand:- start:873 stop:1106 length:234 start_codon:yes stop_codon:yes gene_type:complete
MRETEAEKKLIQERYLRHDLETYECEFDGIEYDTDLIKLEKRIITKYFKKRILWFQTGIALLHNADVKEYFELEEEV